MSVPASSLAGMKRSAHTPSSAAANDAIRRFVAGRTSWEPEELAELDTLWAAWRKAVRTERAQAAVCGSLLAKEGETAGCGATVPAGTASACGKAARGDGA